MMNVLSVIILFIVIFTKCCLKIRDLYLQNMIKITIIYISIKLELLTQILILTKKLVKLINNQDIYNFNNPLDINEKIFLFNIFLTLM